jgi:hypothetical protein
VIRKSVSKGGLLIAVAVMTAQGGFATTGVVLYEKDFAIVAVDGRVNEVAGAVSGHVTECKLDVAHSMVAMVAGLAKEDDVAFDARAILRQAMQQAGSVEEAADQAQRQIQINLPAAAQAFQKSNPDRTADAANIGVQFVVIGVDDAGTVHVGRRSIFAGPSKQGQADNSTGNDEHVGVAVIGEAHAIDQDLDRLHDTKGWEGKGNPDDLEKMARRFIALEVLEQPHRVGPPLAIVLVDRNGVHGVEDGSCGK